MTTVKFSSADADPLAVEFRQMLLETNGARLSEMAWRAINVKGLTTADFVVVCIHVDDDNLWRGLVEVLMPNNEPQWRQLRERGDMPLARGAVAAGVSDMVGEMFPDLAPSLAEPPPEGFARCLALSHSGATVADLQIHPPQEKS